MIILLKLFMMMIQMVVWIGLFAIIQTAIGVDKMNEFDEEPPCSECGHMCSCSEWDGECVNCERRHQNE